MNENEIVLKWAYRYGSLEVSECDSIEDAVRQAVWASDEGGEAFHSIEVIASDGTSTSYSGDDEPVRSLWRAKEAADDQRFREREIPVAGVWLLGPDDTPVLWSSHLTKQEATDKGAALAQRLGAERVVVRATSADRKLAISEAG